MPDAEQRIAWELHVELATRVSGVPLADDRGVAEEAVASLDRLAVEFREILSRHQPHPDENTVNYQIEAIVRVVLADLVDPFVARWKSRHLNPATEAELRRELAAVREALRSSTDRLAELAGAVSLLPNERG